MYEYCVFLKVHQIVAQRLKRQSNRQRESKSKHNIACRFGYNGFLLTNKANTAFIRWVRDVWILCLVKKFQQLVSHADFKDTEG